MYTSSIFSCKNKAFCAVPAVKGIVEAACTIGMEPKVTNGINCSNITTP